MIIVMKANVFLIVFLPCVWLVPYLDWLNITYIRVIYQEFRIENRRFLIYNKGSHLGFPKIRSAVQGFVWTSTDFWDKEQLRRV